MKVVFRVDASVWIGSGHVMRCLVLAEALKRVAYEVSFACLPQQGDMISYIKQRGHHVTKLTPVSPPMTPTDDADYLGWLQRSVEQDALDFVKQVIKADVVVTDHYAIDATWQGIVKQALICRLVAIDDLNRVHDADCIIDQTLGRKVEDYPGNATVLAGTNYALLGSDFSLYRARVADKSPPTSTPNVLISMGGIDSPNATLMVLKSLVGKVEATFTVLLSPRAPHYQKVVAWCAEYDSITHCDFSDNMASLMTDHDVAIGAPGTTSWERACLGLPSIIIPLAENQKEITVQLVKHKAAIALTLNDIHQYIVSAFQKLLREWAAYHRTNMALCDGKGAQRVALSFQQQMSIIFHSDFELTLAISADIQLVFDWQCHPKTRQYALNPSVPSWEEHFSWMTMKLARVEDYFYIVKRRSSGLAVGVLRLDRQQDMHFLVSIFVAPDQHGQGVASGALTLADVVHPNATLHATVLENNQASQHLFEKANYQRISQKTFIRNPIT